MSVSDWCDRASAALSVSQACGITRELRRLESALPVQSDRLSSAIDDIDQITSVGPNAARDLNASILMTAQGIQNMVYANQQLALSPLRQTDAVVREMADDLFNASRGMVGVLDSLNCVSVMMTGKAVPGISRARACILSVAGRIDAELNDIQQTVNNWEAAASNAINTRLNDINDRVGNAILDFQDDHEIVACLSSVVSIPDEIFRTTNTNIQTVNTNVNDIGNQAGGCSGLARQVADLMNGGVQELNEALNNALSLNGEVETIYNNLTSHLNNLTPLDQRVIEQALANIAVPPFTEATQEQIQEVVQQMQQVQVQMQSAAAAASITQIEFTFGHEIHLDRVNDVIRIRHRDKYTLLFDNTNIIAATEVTNKKVAWIENLMLKYNVHTHGATPPPSNQFTLSDGTTIFKAG